jgi:hypothetical protein
MAEPNVLPATLLRDRGTGARHSGMVVASVLVVGVVALCEGRLQVWELSVMGAPT